MKIEKFSKILADRFSEQKAFTSLLVIAEILFLSFLGNMPLKDWDEGTYAVIGREIVRTGNWLYLTLHGEPFLLKPPLGMWSIAASYSIGGISEFTTRLPFATMTALGVPILYCIGRQLFDRQIPALFSALIYLTLLPIARHGRFAMLDGISITFFLIALLCLLKTRQQKIWASGIGITIGLVILTKGILGLVFAVIIGIIIIANRQLKILKNIYLWLGIILGLLPAVVWYAAQFAKYGNTFLQVHFQSQSFDRFSQAIEGHPGPIWYYAIDLIEYSFPWWLLLSGGMIFAWHHRSQSWAKFTAIGGGIYFMVVSIMQTKLPWYGLPVYPFFALLTGAYLSEIWYQRQPVYTKFRWIMLNLASIISILGCGYFSVVEKSLSLVVMSIILAISMGRAAWLVKQRNREFIPTLFIGMYLTFFSLISSQSWAWEINDAFPVPPVARLISSHVDRNGKIYTSFPNGRPSLDFYSDTQVIPTKLTDLSQKLAQNKFVLIDRDSRSLLGNRDYKILGSADRFDLIQQLSISKPQQEAK